MEEQEIISQAMRALGSRTSERKAASSRENRKKARERLQDEDVRARLSTAQQARRERERQEKANQAGPVVTVEKRPAGRPRTRPVETGPARPRGRPRKSAEGVQPDAD